MTSHTPHQTPATAHERSLLHGKTMNQYWTHLENVGNEEISAVTDEALLTELHIDLLDLRQHLRQVSRLERVACSRHTSSATTFSVSILVTSRPPYTDSGEWCLSYTGSGEPCLPKMLLILSVKVRVARTNR